MVVATKLSVTKAARCEIVDEECIEELTDKSQNQNMKKRAEYWKNVFKKWANERNFQEYESHALNQTLSWFYTEIQ